MYPKEAVSTLINDLNGRIPPPVHSGGIEEKRPVPAVLIDGLSLENHNHHNSNYSGSEYTNGAESSRLYRHWYSLRVELVIRADDEMEAFDYLTDLQAALASIGRDPVTELHNDVHEVRTLGSGPVSYQFYEPTETEINQAIRLETFYETEESVTDVIETLQQNLTIS